MTKEVRIPGSGVFEVKERSARKAVVFRPGSELKLAAQSQ